MAGFQSTHPLRGATLRPRSTGAIAHDFNPRTPCGVRHGLAVGTFIPVAFQSTHPLRGATQLQTLVTDRFYISIHAPLAGCDADRPCSGTPRYHFNPRTPCGVRLAGVGQLVSPYRPISIHAPLAGCDVRLPARLRGMRPFQSTHPLRGATRQQGAEACRSQFQSTHPLRGATLRRISSPLLTNYFNPRTPCGVRRCACARKTPRLISIHAPLAGCDPMATAFITSSADFNPRTPCGVRRSKWDNLVNSIQFQSTHPLRGATRLIHRHIQIKNISIHAPLAGCDGWKPYQEEARHISIHAPLAGCDADVPSCGQSD